MPSPTGKWKLINGKLVTDSVDLYLVLEYTDGGDLFHMSEQLTTKEVRQIMDQVCHVLPALCALLSPSARPVIRCETLRNQKVSRRSGK